MGLFVLPLGGNEGKNKGKRQIFKDVSCADVLEKLEL
jgi:hypothetical protein